MKNSKDIAEIVRKYYGIDYSIFYSKTRKREIVQARQIAHKLSKENTEEALVLIGKNIGKKDHATILHSIKTVNNLIDTDKLIRKDYEYLQELIDAYYCLEITEEEIIEDIKTAINKRFAFRIEQMKNFQNTIKAIRL